MASISKMVTKDTHFVPKTAVVLLIGIFLVTIFIVGFDQGHIFSIVQGEEAFNTIWMHEFYHDMRHAAGFPCH